MGVVDQLASLAAWLARQFVFQVEGLFLNPQSTYSLPALLASLSLFVFLAAGSDRRKPVSLPLLRRILLPRRLYKSASGRADLAYFVGGILMSSAALSWAIVSAGTVHAVAAAWLNELLGKAQPLLFGATASVLLTIVLFFAYEFAYWLDHWLKHRVALLWRFHKVHHQAESLSILTNSRVHPVDTVLFANLAALVMGGAGALGERFTASSAPLSANGANALILIAAVAITHLQHSHLWLRFGARGGRYLLGPAHHQIHHSSAPEHHDRNFGSSLAMFDRLFGTFSMPPARRPRLRFGTADDTADPHGWRALLIDPFLPKRWVGCAMRPG